MAETVLIHESLTRQVIGAAIRVHRALGPGLLESAYQACLVHELVTRGLTVLCQVLVPVSYGNIRIDAGFRLDLLVQETVIVEVKSIDRLDRVHEAQLFTYLRLTGKPVGLLINFNVTRLRDGILRRALTKPGAA